MSTTTETQTNSMNIQTHAEEDTRIIQLSEEVQIYALDSEKVKTLQFMILMKQLQILFHKLPHHYQFFMPSKLVAWEV